jgi:enamine deaminase RidA (YjgF/YER057c/UK114 family)
MSFTSKLAELGITLESPTPPAAAYVPYKISGKTLYISGQLPNLNGAMSHTGHLGKNVTLEDGQACARVCAINILNWLNVATNGDLGKVSQFLKLEILVAADPSFAQPHVVANGASQLILDLFGEKGKHARVAYGVAVLPLNAAVEVAATIELC